jgi:hypothetical protein
MCYRLEGDVAYFLIDGQWIHEMFIDFILSEKGERHYEER